VKNWKDALAVLDYLLFCLTLLLSAGFMIFEIVEYAYPEWKAQARMSCPSTQAKVEDCEAVTRPAPQPNGGLP
jgi:hypothetical protein